jgi:hypothetical protein
VKGFLIKPVVKFDMAQMVRKMLDIGAGKILLVDDVQNDLNFNVGLRGF